MSKDGEVLPVELKGGTPSLPNDLFLKLINKIAEVERFKQKGRVKTVKVQNKDEDFKVQDIWPQLKELLAWLLENNVLKGVELFKAIICRRRKELEAEERKVQEQIEDLLNQVKDRHSQKRKDILIEVCCYEESKLSKQFQERGGGAIRISFPKHDLSKEEAEKAIVKVVKKMQSEGFKVHVWTSLPCSPWCAWQRVNKAILHNYQEILEEKK